MGLIQYLCQLLSEECNELGQRASKLSRFGWSEVQSGQELNNYQRLENEKIDLLVVYELIEVSIGKRTPRVVSPNTNQDEFLKKEMKILQFSKLSRDLGQITAETYQQLKAITHLADNPDF